MASSASPIPVFIQTYAYEWIVNKDDISGCKENAAMWGPIKKYGSYGSWILGFYPNGFPSSTPAKFAFILYAIDKPSKVPSFVADIKIFITDVTGGGQQYIIELHRYHQVTKINPCIGCGWYLESFNERYPRIFQWNKVRINIIYEFTSIEENPEDDRNWLTYKFLRSNGIYPASDHFFRLDLEKNSLENDNTDSTINYYIKKRFSKKTDKIELPMHKAKLIQQSLAFAKHFDDHPGASLDFVSHSNKIIEDMVIFCYMGELKSYNETHLSFATKYEMKNLLQKADEYLSARVKRSNVKKMMGLATKYTLPKLTKQCNDILNKESCLKTMCCLPYEMITNLL